MASHTWYRPGVPKGHKDPWGYLRNRRDAKFWVKQRNISLDDIQISDTVYGDRTWFWRPSQRKAKPVESELKPTQVLTKIDEPVKLDSDVKPPKHKHLYQINFNANTSNPYFPETWWRFFPYPGKSSIDPRTVNTGIIQLKAGSWDILLQNNSVLYPCSIQIFIFWSTRELHDIGSPGEYFRNISSDGTLYTSHRTLRNPAYISDPGTQTLYYDKVVLLPDNDTSNGRHLAHYKVTRDLTHLYSKLEQLYSYAPKRSGFLWMGFMAKQYLPIGVVSPEYRFHTIKAECRILYTSDTLIPFYLLS